MRSAGQGHHGSEAKPNAAARWAAFNNTQHMWEKEIGCFRTRETCWWWWLVGLVVKYRSVADLLYGRSESCGCWPSRCWVSGLYIPAWLALNPTLLFPHAVRLHTLCLCPLCPGPTQWLVTYRCANRPKKYSTREMDPLSSLSWWLFVRICWPGVVIGGCMSEACPLRKWSVHWPRYGSLLLRRVGEGSKCQSISLRDIPTGVEVNWRGNNARYTYARRTRQRAIDRPQHSSILWALSGIEPMRLRLWAEMLLARAEAWHCACAAVLWLADRSLRSQFNMNPRLRRGPRRQARTWDGTAPKRGIHLVVSLINSMGGLSLPLTGQLNGWRDTTCANPASASRVQMHV